MFLLDTNVVSELRKVHTVDKNVKAWVDGVDVTSLFLSVVSLEELEIGVLRSERRDPSQGRVLRKWLEQQVLPAFTGRLLSIDAVIVRQSAALHVPDPRPLRDALIAATGIVHQFTVVTRNVADFQPTGVQVLDPWTYHTG